MTKEQIGKLKELFDEKTFRIFVDNAMIVDERAEGTEIVWDDVNEFMYVIRPNSVNYNNQANQPFTFEIFAYENIQKILTENNEVEIKDKLNILKNNSLLTEEQYNNIIETTIKKYRII